MKIFFLIEVEGTKKKKKNFPKVETKRDVSLKKKSSATLAEKIIKLLIPVVADDILCKFLLADVYGDHHLRIIASAEY